MDWKSMTTTACFPITTDFYPLRQCLEQDFQEAPYTVTNDGDSNIATVLHGNSSHRDSFKLVINHEVNVASKESYHFFRATLTKILLIKISQIWTHTSVSSPYEAHLKNQKVAFDKKEKNVVKSQKVIFFFKSQKCSLRTSTNGLPI